ncbi:MAG: ABC transporter permease subunit [Chloroflexi bacterium]|nr:ABC transporter permease subunit [Chloroflexota bacterium]
MSRGVTTWPGRVAGRIDRLSDRTFGWLAFLPGGALVLLFVLPPIIAVAAMSLFRIELLRDDLTPFVGLDNYLRRLPADRAFLDAVPRTVVLAAGVTALTVPLALGCALLLTKAFRGSMLVGIAVLLPWAVAPVVTGLYWKFIFQSQFGLATALANILGIANGPVGWLDTAEGAMVVAIVATAWRMVPLMALLLLGALRTVPEAQYRAARMDGAGAWQAFRFITLPAIAPTLAIVAIMTVILSLQMIDILFTLTGGGPGQSTTVITYYLYRSTIGNLSFGYSGALAVVLFLIILGCSALLLAVRFRRRGTAGPSTDDDSEARPARPMSTLGASSVAAALPVDIEPPRRRRIRLPRWVGRVALVAASVALIAWLVGPVIWIVITSLQPEGAVTQLPPRLTLDLRLSNYTDLLSRSQWQGSIVVSLTVVTLVTLLTLFLGALAAYPLARYEMPGSRVVLIILLLTQMVPAIVVAIPTLLVFRFLGLKDTIAALVIVNTAFWMPLIVWLLRNVFREVPRSLESAARIDGCGRLGTLFRVVMPAAWPGISATAILLLVGTWNEFLFAVMLGDRNAVTVTRLIGFVQATVGPEGPPPFTLVAAAGVTAFLPCLVLVVVFFRRLMSGLSQGYVKG